MEIAESQPLDEELDAGPEAAPEAAAEVVLEEIVGGAGEELPQLVPQGERLALVLDVPVELAVEIGRTRMTIRETLGLAPGSIVALDRAAGEPVDLLVNGRRIARGEVVAVDEEFGFRITELLAPEPGAA